MAAVAVRVLVLPVLLAVTRVRRVLVRLPARRGGRVWRLSWM